MADEQRHRNPDLERARAAFVAARSARDSFGLSGIPADVAARYEAARAALATAAGSDRATIEAELRVSLEPAAAPAPTPAPPSTIAPAAATQGRTIGAATGASIAGRSGAKAGAGLGASIAGAPGAALGAKIGAKLGAAAGARVGGAAGAAAGGGVGRTFDRVRSAARLVRRVPGGWRLAALLERSVPSSSQLSTWGGGSLLAGIDWFARRNPLYRLFSRFLPQVPWIRATAGVACGCSSGAGCGCKCCSCGCMIAPVAFVLGAAVVAILAVAGAFPAFSAPAICERTGVECGDAGQVSYQIDPSDVPSGAVIYWKDAEARTGVPWFYLAAWEKVASDFGRADLSAEARNEGAPYPPSAIIDLLKAQSSSGLSIYESGHEPPDAATSAVLAAEDARLIDDLIRRLRANVRGGSFGNYLITNEEWLTYGNPTGTAPAGDEGSGDVVPGALLPPLAATSPYTCANGVAIDPPDPATNAAERALMSTAFLARIGAPDTPDMRRAVEAWAQQETSWRTRPIYSGNPFSVGAAATTKECGQFTTTVAIAVFDDLRTAVEASADVMLEPRYQIYGYGPAVSAARSGDAQGFLIWLAASGWSGASHYGCGDEGQGSNNLLARYAELGGRLDPLLAECVIPGSTYTTTATLRVLNPYARRDGAYIVGRHLVDIYASLVAGGVTSLRNTAASVADRPTLSEVLAMDAYFTALADAQVSPNARRYDDSGVPFLFAQMVGYRDDAGGLFGTGLFGSGSVRPKIDGWSGTCITGSSPCVIVGGSWPTGDEVPALLAGTTVTPLQRAYACTLVSQKAAAALLGADPVAADTFLAEACDRFVVRAGEFAIGGKATLAEALGDVYIPASQDPPPGRAVLDWEGLSTLMSALLAQDGAWADPTAVVRVPLLTGEEVDINVYAAAIDEYARAIYEGFSAAEVRRAGGDTPEGRARAAELRFYGPLVDDALGTPGIAVDRTVLLATLVADEVMGNIGSTAGCQPYYASPSRIDGTAPLADTSVLARYDAILAADGAVVPSVLRDARVREAAADEKVDPFLLVALAGATSDFNAGFSSEGRVGLFGLTEADARLYGVDDRTDATGSTSGAARKAAALLASYGLKGAIGVWFGGAAALEVADGNVTRLPAATRAFIADVVARYTELVARNPLTADLADAPVSALIGCYRWGAGEAVLYDPDRSTDPEPYAIAMNFCAPGPSDCGSAVIRVGNRAVVVKVTDFFDGAIGERDDRIAAIRPAVRDALGLSGNGPFAVEIELLGRSIAADDLGPLGERAPATLGIDLVRAADRVLERGAPSEAVAALLAELRVFLAREGLVASDIPNLGHYGRFLAARGGCPTPEASLISVTDPFRPAAADGLPATAKVADCTYVASAIAAIEDFLAGRAGAVNSAQYGLQAVSQFGYINPIVGARVSSGFLPRSFATSLKITANGRTYAVHDGVDFVIRDFSDNLVVAVSDGLAYWKPGREVYCRPGCTSFVHRPTMLLYVRGDDGATWLYGHVVAEYFADPVIAAAYATSELRAEGYRAVRVRQGDTLAQIAAGPNHLHLEVSFPARSLTTPYRYPFLNDPNATYSDAGNPFRIDPLSLLPQTLDEYAGGYRSSLGEYASANPYPGAPNSPFPPPAIASLLPGWKGSVTSTGSAGIAPGAVVLAPQLIGPAGGTARWTALAGAAGYDIRLITAVESDCEVAGGIPKRTGTVTSLAIDAATFASRPTGAWAVCVRARFADGRVTGWTRGATTAKVGAPVANTNVTAPFTVRWAPIAGAVAYTVELSRSSDFASPVTITATTTSVAPPGLATGVWHVRVTTLVATATGGRTGGPAGPGVRFTLL